MKNTSLSQNLTSEILCNMELKLLGSTKRHLYAGRVL